jgi:hypothetical protein
MAKSKAQKLKKNADRVRKAKMDRGPRIYKSLSAGDLDFLWEEFEKSERRAAMRALEGLSLDPRQFRKAWEPPPPAPGPRVL